LLLAARNVNFRHKRKRVLQFQTDLERAVFLFNALIVNGATLYNRARDYTPLRQVDRRDVAAAIFFEVAAKFEAFAYFCFQYEVCRRFRASAAKATYLMGSPDRGTEGTFGWASPERLRERGLNLFGVSSFFGRLNVRLNQSTRESLTLAHLLRNRVAHQGGRDRKKMETHLNRLHVPKSSRKGLSVGRLLLEYPVGSKQEDRLFFTLLKAYNRFAVQFLKYG